MSKKIVKKSPIDFKVKVIFYGLPEMDKEEILESLGFLKSVVEDIKKEKDKKVFSKRCIYKLMK